MPVSSESHSWRDNSSFVVLEPPRIIPRKLFLLECAECGYEVEQGVTPPDQCPRCRAWNRFQRVRLPGSTLAHADEYPEGTDPRVGFDRRVVVTSLPGFELGGSRIKGGNGRKLRFR